MFKNGSNKCKNVNILINWIFFTNFEKLIGSKFRSDEVDGQPEEWCIIELQGDLEVENGESLANKFMADLHYNKDGTPIMILG